jgi:Protein of unknown function (DUF3037)
MTVTTRIPYSYSVLRYIHDIGTGEFINVGVVLTSGSSKFVAAKFKMTFGRLKATFPTIDAEVFKTRMRRLQTTFNQISDGHFESRNLSTENSLDELIHSVIKADDSSLQWSPPGSGLSKDLQNTLTTLHQRFVTKYDIDLATERRKDEDVWRQFKLELEKRNVMSHLEEKVIEVADDSVKFEHAWKNGVWHCYEPISFDLASDSSIKDKAHKWLGQISSIQKSKEDFSVYFLVGKPESEKLHSAYQKALSILNKAPACKIIEEKDAQEFSETVATKIAQHETRQI